LSVEKWVIFKKMNEWKEFSKKIVFFNKMTFSAAPFLDSLINYPCFCGSLVYSVWIQWSKKNHFFWSVSYERPPKKTKQVLGVLEEILEYEESKFRLCFSRIIVIQGSQNCVFSGLWVTNYRTLRIPEFWTTIKLT
jgi:hypothetical protein